MSMGTRDAIARALMDLPVGVVRWASAPTEELPRLSSGIPELDRLLGGGWRKGRIAVLQGSFSDRTTGATTIAAATVACATARGALAAWIDGDNSFDPVPLAAAGADLARLLWVRGPMSPERVLRIAEETLRVDGFELLVARLPWSEGAHLVRLSRAVAVARSVMLLVNAFHEFVPGGLSVRLERFRCRFGGGLLLGAQVEVKVDGRTGTTLVVDTVEAASWRVGHGELGEGSIVQGVRGRGQVSAAHSLAGKFGEGNLGGLR